MEGQEEEEEEKSNFQKHRVNSCLKNFYLVAKEHHESVIKYITNNFFSSRSTWSFPSHPWSLLAEKDHCNDFLQFMLEYVCANCDFKEDYSFEQIYRKLYNILGNIMLTLFICHLVKDVYKIVLSIWVARGQISRMFLYYKILVEKFNFYLWWGNEFLEGSANY